MKAIIGLFRPVPKTKDSHNAAYAEIWGNLIGADCLYLNADYQEAEELFLHIDINYKGSVNLFDGLSEGIYERMNKLIEYAEQGKTITILDHEMPDMEALFMSRLDNDSTFEKITENWIGRLAKASKNIKTITMHDLVTDSVTIGDSHSMSIADAGTPIFRLDAKTLHGALKDDFIKDMIPDGVKKIRLMFGSIDIRHHLFRFDTPYKAADDLLLRYKAKIAELQELYEVEIHTPVPIEFEGRKMAATSQYKKTNFYGSVDDRRNMTNYFIEEMNLFKDELGIEVLNFPSYWYNLDPADYAEKIMERPRGLHVGFSNYKMNNYGEVEVEEW